MNETRFWSLIERIEGTKRQDESTDFEPLVAELSKQTEADIHGFFEYLAQKTYALDTRKHYRRFSWFPGLSDTFLYTRLMVVAQGKQDYEAVLRNPKAFPKRSTKWLEGLLYVADEAYSTVTGLEFPREATVDIESFSNEEGWAK
ncbi:DUF4240 domain-containing protein [Shimia sp. Alg240-R146]|uniref:DUF4240 domain-containing protein n=1 Tax=Shimia sp. Alg240-R146 TaxID=2993449 RepID=UPI0022E4816C|nr:DUF4240 domain-containing protein [Shimia sp. Alg240-R146]